MDTVFFADLLKLLSAARQDSEKNNASATPLDLVSQNVEIGALISLMHLSRIVRIFRRRISTHGNHARILTKRLVPNRLCI